MTARLQLRRSASFRSFILHRWILVGHTDSGPLASLHAPRHYLREDLVKPAATAEVARQPLAELVGAGLEVPLVQGGQARYVNLDYAATTPSLALVTARIAEVLPWYASVHRGSGYLSLVSTSLYESARASVHRFVGARSEDVVVFTRNTTDALNLLVRAVPAGGEIVYLDIEHHADLLPWQRHQNRCVRAGTTLAETMARVVRALEERPVALLAITGASNVTGEIVPLAAVVQIAHERGARVAVDAAEPAPHRGIDLAAVGADYAAFSGHKCYAPFGSGVLVGRRDWLDQAPAYLAGGGAIESVTVEDTIWAPSPERHEGGTPNFVGAVALAQACGVLAELVRSGAVESHEATLRQRLVDGLGSLEGVRQLRIWEDSTDAIGIVAFEVRDHEAALVAACLSSEHAVGVRDGSSCAHPLMARISGGRAALRASFGIGTTIDDVDRLVEALSDYLQMARDVIIAPRQVVYSRRRHPAHPFPRGQFDRPGLLLAAVQLVSRSRATGAAIRRCSTGVQVQRASMFNGVQVQRASTKTCPPSATPACSPASRRTRACRFSGMGKPRLPRSVPASYSERNQPLSRRMGSTSSRNRRNWSGWLTWIR